MTTENKSEFINPFSLNEGFIRACFSEHQMFVPGTTLCKCYALAVVKAVLLNYGNEIQAKHLPLPDACTMRSHRVNSHAHISLPQATHMHADNGPHLHTALFVAHK